MVADPCALPSNLAAVDCILAALILRRLSHPKHFLESIPRLLKKDGTIVLVTPYDWQLSFLSSKNEEQEILREDAFKGFMEKLGLELIHEENLPFLQKVTQRQYHWFIAQATVWRHANLTKNPSNLA